MQRRDARRSPIKAVLFDYGGVISSATRPATRSERSVAHRLGITTDQLHARLWTGVDDLEGAVGAALCGRASLEEVIADRQAVVGAEFAGADIADMVGHLASFPVDHEMLDVIRRTRQAGLKTALASNQYSEFAPVLERRIPMEELFDAIVFSCDIGVQKPRHEFFEQVLERVDVANPSQALLLDDTLANIDAAQAIGMQAIHVGNHMEAINELAMTLELPALTQDATRATPGLLD